ncbi:MAG: UDP-N-acetylglucosamine 1-carboxyvinyltransferase [Rhodothermaceae bacterium]|nr:UDP-N-acetylglucosamine 1-carboxyvinyltransferase [Rhodothermaceae bacterium]
MDKFVIEGPVPLKGEIPISGSKNAALPLIAATLLCDSPSEITNIPDLHDIATFNNVMRVTGARVNYISDRKTLEIDPTNVTYLEAPYDLVRKMRASFYMLGALLGKHGHAKISLPGGCAWGPRPVNLHLEGMKALGANISMDKGYIIAEAPGGRLRGGTFKMEPSSVGATVNLLLAAVRAEGKTVLKNAAMEPDVVYLCEALSMMGARISGTGTDILEIHGVEKLSGIKIANSPDRIETGTFMIAAAMHPESDVVLTGTRASDLGDFLRIFARTGVITQIEENTIRVKAPEKVVPVSIKTKIYPGFPTDLQAQWATLMTQADGISTVTDNIYYDRFSYVPELVRLGARMELEENTVTIEGRTELSGASVMSTDLRASVSLVMAAMAAKGTTEVLRVYHLDRGYENLETKLTNAGARISRVET